MEPLVHKAATSGDLDFLQKIRAGEASSNLLRQRTPNSNNVLHLAAQFKNTDFFKVVSSFVEGFPPVWDANKMGDTPLHIAARVGCVELVDFLVDRAKMLHVQRAGCVERGTTFAESYKKLLRKTNLKMHTALHVAAQYGHHGVVIELMKADPELCCSGNSAKESPLFLATCKGFSNIAGEILEEPSVSPSFQGINGVTALHAAVSHTYEGAEEIVKSMISKNPDMIKKADALGWTPLHYATFRGNLEAVTLLMESDKFRTCYISDKCGMTALHIAAYKGHIEVMKKLIQYQPDACECLNAKGQTILHVAVLSAQIAVVKYILELPGFSIPLDQADEEGYTPWQLSVMSQNHEITKMLTLESGVDSTSTVKGFSLVFDNFLGEDIKIQEMHDESSHHQGRSFGVPSFQEQISRDFKKFESNLDDKDSGKPAVAGNAQIVKADVNLLIATLIATVTFTAALAPPGGYGDNGKAILQDDKLFRWFETFNMVSFFFSLMVLLHESIVAYLGPIVSKVVHPFTSRTLVVFSLYGMLLALLTGTEASLDNKRERNPRYVFPLVFFFLAAAPSVVVWIARHALLRKESADS